MKFKYTLFSIITIVVMMLFIGCSSKSSLYEKQSNDNAHEGDNLKKTILFDASHGQTSGEADWVIDGGFSEFGDALKSNGYHITQTDGMQQLNQNTLKEVDVLVMPEANIPLKINEQQAIIEFVEKGGGIFFISNHYNGDRNFNRFDSSEVMNGYRRGAMSNPTKGMSNKEKHAEAMQDVEGVDFLHEHFGVRFRYNSLDKVQSTQIASPDQSFGITEGVEKIEMNAGSTIAITNPEIAKGIIYPPKLSKKDAWDHAVDQGVYNGGGRDEGAMMALSVVGKGKAFFAGDSSYFEDDSPKYKREDNGREKTTYPGFNEFSHKTIALNAIKWLLSEDEYESLPENIERDKITPLLDEEEPGQGKEYDREPWGSPEKGYDWFDPKTFEKGSYLSQINNNNAQNENNNQNSDNNHNKNKTYKDNNEIDSKDKDQQFNNKKYEYTLNFPFHVNTHETFEIVVYVHEGRLDDQKMQLGIETQQGKVISKFLEGNESSDASYSKEQQYKVKDGYVTHKFKIKIDDSYKGRAQIKLKSNNKVIQENYLTIH